MVSVVNLALVIPRTTPMAGLGMVLRVPLPTGVKNACGQGFPANRQGLENRKARSTGVVRIPPPPLERHIQLRKRDSALALRVQGAEEHHQRGFM